MKIISSPEGGVWSKQFGCGECSSVLEITVEDVFVRNCAVAYAGETWEPELFFECPICSGYVKVTDEIPFRMQMNLFDEYKTKND